MRAVVLGVLVALILAVGLPAPAPVVAASGGRVVIVVGPSGSETADFRRLADSLAQSARRYASMVTEVKSPQATWRNVWTAARGANVLIYLGRGRGFPSSYSSRLVTATEDGFGLNPQANHGDTMVRYYGEYWMRQLQLAPSAVVLLINVPYSAGGTGSRVQPSLSTVRQRIDNYGAGFLAAGASAVISDLFASSAYYIRAIFTQTATLDAVWRAAPTRNGHSLPWISARTPGSVLRADPELPRSGYDRAIVGRLKVTTAAVRLGGPPPPPPPVTGPSLYGSAINADDLNNSVVGGPEGRAVSYRFEATTTADLNAIRIYLVTGSGYSGGTNGTMEITVQTDDGTSAHSPSGTVLARTTYTPGGVVANDGLPQITFASPAHLTSGRLYHIVFRDVDVSPTANYISVDGLFTFGDPSPWQPKFTNVNWANLIYFQGQWSDNRGAGKGVITPIMALYYSNGVTAGQGYMEVWVSLPKTISGTTMVREQFTVSGASRTVTVASVRIHRVSGSAALTIRLETSSGSLVAQGTVSGDSISAGSHPVWATVSFGSSVTLASGASYHLVLSAPSGTTYNAFAIREGARWGFPANTYFADGIAQYTIGSGWLGFDQPGGRTNLTMGDLQFALN